MIFDFIKSCNFDENSVILEIGSHMGFDTEKIKEQIGNARFYGFEPDTRNLDILRERGIDKICEITNAAVGNSDSHVVLHKSSGQIPELTNNPYYDNNPWTASSSIRPPKKHTEIFPWCEFNDNEVVAQIKLDTFCTNENIESINFIWMDVQGCEDLVFEGARKILEKTEYIYTEYSDDELYEDQKNLDTLLSMLPGEWMIRKNYGGDVLLENVTYRDSLIKNTGAWSIKNMNEHAFDESLAAGIVNLMLNKNLSKCFDFGCGPGQYVQYFKEYGIDTRGYDGNIHTAELSNGLCEVLDLTDEFDLGTADLVLCLEVGEHVPKEYESVLLDNIAKHSDNMIILSWGVPGQGGYGHVNCQTNDYIKEQMFMRGFDSVDKIENILRSCASMTWFKDTIMVFKKRK